MDQFEFEGKKEVKEFLEKNIRFTPAESERVREKIRQKRKKHLRVNPVYWTVLIAAASLFLILSLSFMDGSNTQFSTGNPGISEPANSGDPTTGMVSNAYEGEPLKIAVLGELPKSKFDNITFESAELEYLVKNTKGYDAYFVTDQYFEELATDQWTTVFKNIQVPVFFLGLDAKAFIFYENNMDYNDEAHSATSQVQGFVQVTEDGEAVMKTWEIGDSTSSTYIENITEETYITLFNEIDKFYKMK